jgi:hypothetical protein
MIAFLLGLAAGFVFGFALFRSERAYKQGFRDGERYGRGEGYRQAWVRWIKEHKPLLNAQTDDWETDARPEDESTL